MFDGEYIDVIEKVSIAMSGSDYHEVYLVTFLLSGLESKSI